MKIITKFIIVAAISIAFSAVAFGQNTRITFGPGATSKVVSGTLDGYKSQRSFVIKVKKGQRLTTEDVGKNAVTIGIDAPKGSTYEQDMAADCHSRNDVNPTAAGDYVITVTECQKADAWKGTFKFKVVVH